MYTLQEQYEQAIDVYTEALDHSPDNPDILTTVGLLYLRLGQNYRAFDYLSSSLSQDPRSPKSILAAGSIIQDHNDMDVALVKYRIAACQTPNSAQLWNNVGMCFLEADARVLTDVGFLFLPEVEERLALCQANKGPQLLFACYDRQSKGLVYRPGLLKFPAKPPVNLVDFTEAHTKTHWDEKSDEFGAAAGESLHANHLSLRVTEDHMMYVQVGSRSGDMVHMAQNGGEIPYRKMAARELASSYVCDCPDSSEAAGRRVVAQGSECLHGRDSIRMLGAAVGGFLPDQLMGVSGEAASSPVARLGLDTATKLDAFLTLYGYWLGDGSMMYRTQVKSGPRAGSYAGWDAVRFTTKKDADDVEGLLRVFGLPAASWSRGAVAADDTITFLVRDARWFALFNDEYGLKYAEGARRMGSERVAAKLEELKERGVEPSSVKSAKVRQLQVLTTRVA